VLDLGDVEGPEKERRGDRVTRGRGDFSIAECACLPRPRSGPGPVGRDCGMRNLKRGIGRQGERVTRGGRDKEIRIPGYQEERERGDAKTRKRNLLINSFQGAKRVAQGVVSLPRIEP
jgi:hypothetical protein